MVTDLCQAVQGTAATHDAGIMVIREIAVVMEHRHVECGEMRGKGEGNSGDGGGYNSDNGDNVGVGCDSTLL